MTSEFDVLDAIEFDSGACEGELSDKRPYWFDLGSGEFWIYAKDEEEFGDNTVERWRLNLSAHRYQGKDEG